MKEWNSRFLEAHSKKTQHNIFFSNYSLWSRISGRQANEPTPWMSAVLEAADRLGVDGRQCVLRSICEAHQQPQRYGYLVLPVHLLTMLVGSYLLKLGK